MINRLAVLAIVSTMCIAATGPCSTGPINSASATHACDRAASVGATVDEILSALRGIGVAPDKIGAIIDKIHRGEVILTTTCAVVQIVLPPPPTS